VSAECKPYAYDRRIGVKTNIALNAALLAATPGLMIEMLAGSYEGAYKALTAGTAAKPIVLCGPRAAVLSAPPDRPVFELQASFWALSGFTITGGLKGIMMDGASHNHLVGLLIHGIGEEGIHFRTGSSDNILESSEVTDTGMTTAGFGEAVYIGSASSQWVGGPDKSDRNSVLNNKLGPGVKAECIDVKEGTTGGTIQGNQFDGSDIAGQNSADSWVDVKGNEYTLDHNVGHNTPLDGFQVHVVVSGWGNDNVFSGNLCAVASSGAGFDVQKGATGNKISCDNKVTGGSFGNVKCSN
jgi:hypothetical protein